MSFSFEVLAELAMSVPGLSWSHDDREGPLSGMHWLIRDKDDKVWSVNITEGETVYGVYEDEDGVQHSCDGECVDLIGPDLREPATLGVLDSVLGYPPMRLSAPALLPWVRARMDDEWVHQGPGTTLAHAKAIGLVGEAVRRGGWRG